MLIYEDSLSAILEVSDGSENILLSNVASARHKKTDMVAEIHALNPADSWVS